MEKTMKNVVQELRDLRKVAELLGYIVNHVQMTDAEWKYIGANVEILSKRVNDIITELTDFLADIDLTKSFIEHGNYNDAKTSLIAIADLLSAMTGDDE
jgi:hypothetical protein